MLGYRKVPVLCVVFVFGFAQASNADFIASWSGNGNANDSVAGHNGTLVNGAGFASGQFGQEAFQLNGINQYISVPSSTAWDFGSNPFTIALWANFDSISGRPFGAAGNTLIADDEGGGNQNKWFFSYLSNGSLGFHINSGGTGPIFLTSPNQLPVSAGEWNLFAVTKSGNTYTFYENGTSLGSVINNNPIPAVNARLTIGEAEGLGYFDGRMQVIQIYNQALSQQEIAQLSNPTAVPVPSTLVMSSIMFGIFGVVWSYKRVTRVTAAA